MPLYRNNKTGIPGVWWDAINRRWEVTISVKDTRIRLGKVRDFFEACCLRKAAEQEYGFHPNHGKSVEDRKWQ